MNELFFTTQVALTLSTTITPIVVIAIFGVQQNRINGGTMLRFVLWTVPRNARFPVFEAMVFLPRSMASSLLALPRSWQDLGKDTMAMQDRAKANHDFGKDAKINHVLDKASW